MPSTDDPSFERQTTGGHSFIIAGASIALLWLGAVAAAIIFIRPFAELDPAIRAACAAAAAAPSIAMFGAGLAAQGAANAARAARDMRRATDRLLHPETVQALDAATLERWAKRQISQLNESLSSTVEHLSALDAAFRAASDRLRASAGEADKAYGGVTADLEAVAARFEEGVGHVGRALDGAREAMAKGAESALETAQLADERLTRITAALDLRTKALGEAGDRAAAQVEEMDDALRRAVEKFEAVSETALTSSEGLASRFDSRAEELLDAADRIDSRRREFDDALWRGAETLSQTAERVAERAEIVGQAIEKGAETLHKAGEEQLGAARILAEDLRAVTREIAESGEQARADLKKVRDAARDTLERALAALGGAQTGFQNARDGAQSLIAALEIAGERQTRLLEDVVARRLAKSISLANQAIERSETLEREALRRLRRSHERGRAAMRFTGRPSGARGDGPALRDLSVPEIERETYPGVAGVWAPPQRPAKPKKGAISTVAARLSSIFAAPGGAAAQSASVREAWTWDQVLAVAGADKDDLPDDPATRRALAKGAAEDVRRMLADTLGEAAFDPKMRHADPRKLDGPEDERRHHEVVEAARRLFLEDDAFNESARRFIAAYEHDAKPGDDADDPLGLARLLDDKDGRLYLVIGEAIGHLDRADGAEGGSEGAARTNR